MQSGAEKSTNLYGQTSICLKKKNSSKQLSCQKWKDKKNSDLSTTYQISHIIGVYVNLSVTKMKIPIDFIICTGCTVEFRTSGMIPMTSCYNVHKFKKYTSTYIFCSWTQKLIIGLLKDKILQHLLTSWYFKSPLKDYFSYFFCSGHSFISNYKLLFYLLLFF